MDAKFAGEQALRSHGIDYCIVRRTGPRSPGPPKSSRHSDCVGLAEVDLAASRCVCYILRRLEECTRHFLTLVGVSSTHRDTQTRLPFQPSSPCEVRPGGLDHGLKPEYQDHVVILPRDSPDMSPRARKRRGANTVLGGCSVFLCALLVGSGKDNQGSASSVYGV